jgi:ribosomal protein S18 acetylase RimI-like enzyme
MFDIEFRPLKEEDLEWFTITRNSSRKFLHDQREFSYEDACNWFIEKKNNIWVVTNSDLLFGYFRFHIDEGTSNAWIGLDLSEDYRGIGLAKFLYWRFIKEIAVSSGAENLFLRVLKSNSRAYSLYLKLGFKEISQTEYDLTMHMSCDNFLASHRNWN